MWSYYFILNERSISQVQPTQDQSGLYVTHNESDIPKLEGHHKVSNDQLQRDVR